MMEREREFTRAAAHDLRTPLTALQARIQGALTRPRDAAHYRDTLSELGRDVSRLSRLTEHLLLLARDETAFHPSPPISSGSRATRWTARAHARRR